MNITVNRVLSPLVLPKLFFRLELRRRTFYCFQSDYDRVEELAEKKQYEIESLTQELSSLRPQMDFQVLQQS